MSLRTKPSVAAGMVLDAQSADGTIRTIDYQPGNGSRYPIILVTISQTGPKAMARMGFPQEAVLVTFQRGDGDFRSMVLDGDGGYLAPQYVSEKLRVSPVDGMILAELFAFLTGREADDASDPKVRRLAAV